MKKIKKKISLLLSAGLTMSCMAAVPNVSLAADEHIIPFGAVCSFDKFTLSYKDAQTADVMIAFSEDGTNYGEYQTVSFLNDTDETKYLESTAKAKCAKLRVGSEGLPKIKLEQIVRYSSSKANVGLGSRGIDGNTKPMWSAANDNFTQFFDGTYNADGSIANLGKCNLTGLYHDAIKEGKTTDKSLAMVELPFVFDEALEFAYAIVYMDASNAADFYVRIPDKNAKNRHELTKANDFGELKTIDSETGNKSVFVIKAPLCNEGEKTNSVDFYWHNFHNYTGTPENAMVNMPEIAFYYYSPVFESEYILHDGAEYTFDTPKTFSRIVGELPADMWYVGIKADGGEADFRVNEGATGYFADNLMEIKKIIVRGYNAENVAKTKLPNTIRLYGEVSDLAKSAYTVDSNSVTIEGKATDADFGSDPRKDYMSVEKETGIAALFDGDTQYNSYAPYHPFVDSDPDRLTLKSNSSITVDFGKKAIVDTVSYYAGPQYTPKKYDVYVSDTAAFGSKPVFSKSYDVVEGRLSPFVNDYGPYYCAMHEDQNVTNAEGRYIKIANNGVLKPESDRLQIVDQNGNTVVDTVMKNDALMNKNVILAKELRVMGAPLVESITTGEQTNEFTVTCKYNDDNEVKAGDNKLTFTVSNATDKVVNDITIYVAVYNSDKTLKSIKIVNTFNAEAGDENIEKTIENVLALKGDTVRPFVWNLEQKPLATIDGVVVQ